MEDTIATSDDYFSKKRQGLYLPYLLRFFFIPLEIKKNCFTLYNKHVNVTSVPVNIFYSHHNAKTFRSEMTNERIYTWFQTLGKFGNRGGGGSA